MLVLGPLTLRAATTHEFFSAQKATTSSIKGDVNNDGALDISDVLCTVDYILGKDVSDFDANVADVNKDGDIDISDVLMIVDIILGKIIDNPDNPSLPIDNPEGGDPGTGV